MSIELIIGSILILGLGLGLALPLVALGIDRLRIGRSLGRDTMSILDAKAADEGQFVQIEGEVTANSGQVLAPESGRACLAYEHRIEREDSDSSMFYTTESSSEPFVVSDGTGDIVVDPAAANILGDVDHEVTRGNETHFERLLKEGETVRIHGRKQREGQRDRIGGSRAHTYPRELFPSQPHLALGSKFGGDVADQYIAADDTSLPGRKNLKRGLHQIATAAVIVFQLGFVYVAVLQ